MEKTPQGLDALVAGTEGTKAVAFEEESNILERELGEEVHAAADPAEELEEEEATDDFDTVHHPSPAHS
jgi:hypothetical protein